LVAFFLADSCWANVITLDFEDLVPWASTQHGDIVTHGVIIRQVQFAGERTRFTHVSGRPNYAGGTGNELKIGMDTEFIFGQTVHELTFKTGTSSSFYLNGERVTFNFSFPNSPSTVITDHAIVTFNADTENRQAIVSIVGDIESLVFASSEFVDDFAATTPEPGSLVVSIFLGGSLLFRRSRAN